MARKTVRRWIWAWRFDVGERWLNEEAARGWVLDGVGYCTYEFKSCEPGEYAVRLELLQNAVDTNVSQEYIAFVEETGAEYVGRVMKWVYFRKKVADGGFELFSDIDSRIRHLKRILELVAFVAGGNLLAGLNMLQYSGWCVINLMFAAVLGYGTYCLHLKKKRLEGERVLHE